MELDPHQQALLQAAPRLGVSATLRPDLVPPSFVEAPRDAVTYSRGDRAVTIFVGRSFPDLTAEVCALCADKHRTKAYLAGLGLPVPAGLCLPRGADPAQQHAALAALPGGTFVAKPLDGTNGEGVHMDLHTPAQIAAAVAHLIAHSAVVVEAQIAGRDLRLQAIGGRLVAGCVREPAQVVGDGRTPVSALAEARDRVVQAQNPQNRLLLDAESLRLLAEQGLTRASIPAPGQVVVLKRVANIGQGGAPVDVTDALHPGYAAWCARIAAALGLSIFGLDVIAADPSADPDVPGAAAILELNAQPQWLHHTFSEGRTHDIPALLLGALLG